MKLEATKFRPREVVKHVLQTAAASLQKILTLEGHVSSDVPVEVRALLHVTTVNSKLLQNKWNLVTIVIKHYRDLCMR